MSSASLLLPVFVQVTLTFALMFWMARLRVGSIARKEVRMGDIALGEPNWPARTTQVANAFHNQLELPMLFYVVVILALITQQVSLPLVALAWAFVAFRLIHAYIHTGSNSVRHRFNAFAVSLFALLAMWIVLAVQTVTASLA
jgi:hypothetical protein